MAVKGQYRIPFDRQGNLLHHAVDDRFSGPNVEWRQNTPFELTVHLERHRRGRSAAYFIWLDDDGHEYPMFMKEIFDVIEHCEIKKGSTVTARWTVAKRGQNYGLRLHPED